MGGSDSRRPMTIRLSRADGALSRAYDLSGAPTSLAAPPTPGPSTREADLADLDALARRLDRGSPEEIVSLVTDAGLDEAGRILFQALFGADDQLERLLRDLFDEPAGPAPDPATYPVRVRIVTADPGLLGMPWRLTTFRGARLVERRWTFEATPEAALRPPPPSPWNRLQIFNEGTYPPERLPSRTLVRPQSSILRDVCLPAIATGPREAMVVSGRRARVLVVAPGVDPDLAIPTSAHVRALRRALAEIGAPHGDPGYLAVVRTPADLREALATMRPEILDYHGSVEAPGGVPSFRLALRSGEPVRLPVADLLRWAQPSPPLVCFVQGLFLDAQAWGAAIPLLARDLPLVVANRPASWQEGAGAVAIAWLCACLSEGVDPGVAIHAIAAPSSVYGATAAVLAAYERWSRSQEHESLVQSATFSSDGERVLTTKPSRFVIARRCALDEQRAAALDSVTRLAGSAAGSALAVIAPAPPLDLGDPGGRPFVDELDLAGWHLGRVRSMTIPFPLQDEDPLRALKAALLEGIDASSVTDLEDAWRNIAALTGRASRRFDRAGTTPRPPEVRSVGAPRADAISPEAPLALDPAENRCIVWLDWGTFGPAPRRSLSTAELSAWLELAADVLAPHCPPSIRIVSFLALAVDREKAPRFEAYLADRRARLLSPRFDCVLLPGVTPLDRDEVRSALLDAGPSRCPDEWVEPLTNLVFARTQGDRDGTTALVTEAQETSWAAVLRTLRGEDAPGAPGSLSDEEVL